MSTAKTQKAPILSFRCPAGMYERIQRHATALHMNTSEFIHTALKYAIGTPNALSRELAALPQHSQSITH